MPVLAGAVGRLVRAFANVARAKGGAGLIISGACAIAFPFGAASTKEPGLSDDKYIPGLKALADAIHTAGRKLCIQSTHHGKVARVDVANDRGPRTEPAGLHL